MPDVYDVFFSHAWADGALPGKIADELRRGGLRVWFDATAINDFAGITHAVSQGLAQSKVLLAYYSKKYPIRHACQWELTTAFLAAQAEGDPRSRILVINPESQADHIHPIELRDAKFQAAPNDDSALAQLVRSVSNYVATIKGPLSDINPLTAPTWYGMTPVGSTRFVGRLSEMWRVHSALHRRDVAQISGASAGASRPGQIIGLAGIGKSLLAEGYALRFGAAYPGGIFWLRGYGNDGERTLTTDAREAELWSQLRSFAERLGIAVGSLSQSQIRNALARAIEDRRKPCLWIVDDLPSGLDGDTLRRWFAPQNSARTLMTTRTSEYSSLAEKIDLSVLTKDEAYQLLTSRRMPADQAERQQAYLVAQDLGYHALAVDVTASAVVFSPSLRPYASFRERIADDETDVIELAASLADTLPNGHEKSIAKTILVSVRQLDNEGLDFLRLASHMAVAPIPMSIVAAVFEKAEGASRQDAEDRAARAFKQIASSGLSEVAGKHKELREVHALVSRTVRFAQNAQPERTRYLCEVLIRYLTNEVFRLLQNPQLREQFELEVAHARHLIATQPDKLSAALQNNVARYDLVAGNLASARSLFERLLRFHSEELGEEHHSTLTSKNNLAEVLRNQGHLVAAVRLHEETLEARKRVLGPDCPAALQSMNNLALAWQDSGDWERACELFKSLLDARIKRTGLEDLETLISMNNLANALFSQGRWVESRKLHEDALEIKRRILEPDHPVTLQSADGLAVVLSSLGDLQAAHTLTEETLATKRRVMGPEHRATLFSMNNLAEVLRMQGDLDGARKLLEETLAVRSRILGPEHPETLTSMHNLGELLRLKGELGAARSLTARTLAMKRQVLGPEHPETLNSMNNLALILSDEGDWENASKLNEETLTLLRLALGVDHPRVFDSMNNKAELLRKQGRFREARMLHEETLDAKRRVLGPTHPKTIQSLRNLERTIHELGCESVESSM